MRVGQRCDPRFNRTRPSYRRYGFLCTSRASNESPTLFRIAQPRPAPTACPGIGPTPTSVPPGAAAALVGESPLWIGPYLHRELETGIWRYRQRPGLRGTGGWSVKFLWLLAKDVAGAAQVSIVDLERGTQLSITIGGSYTERGTELALDPARPSHPDVPSRPGTHEWGSYVDFPAAGCYRLDARWPGGSWNLVFSFGR
jgi:hypothetical protein